MCPVCETTLVKYDKHYACENAHSFDIARQGYVNLLLSHQKKTLQPGDNKEMVKSRLRFLHQDHYLPLAKMLNSLVEKNLDFSIQGNIQIADLGCGVGYYVSLLKASLSQSKGYDIGYWGIDISKEAILCASTQTKGISWLVCSAKKLPFKGHWLDIVLCIFSPFYIEELTRVIKPQGRVYIITPGNDHLKELKNMLYDEVLTKESEKILEKTQGYLHLEECLLLTYTLDLQSKEDIENLIKMTPFYWRISAQKQAQFSKINALTVTIDMRIWSFTGVNT